MKSGSSCVSRKKNLLLRFCVSGLIRQNPFGIHGSTKLWITFYRHDTVEFYPKDGRCSFANNLSKNVSEVVYTVVEMVKAYGLNIYGST